MLDPALAPPVAFWLNACVWITPKDTKRKPTLTNYVAFGNLGKATFMDKLNHFASVLKEGYLMESLKGNSEMLWLGKLDMLFGKELMMVAAW